MYRTVSILALALCLPNAGAQSAPIGPFGNGPARVSWMPDPISLDQARRAGPGHPWQARIPGVNLDSRAKLTDIPILVFRDVAGMPFELALHHSSQAVFGNPALDPKWSHSFDTHLDVWSAGGTQMAALVRGDHRVQLWQRTGSTWTALDGYRELLVASGGGMQVSRSDGSRLEFESAVHAGKLRWRLARQVDRNGNQLVCGYGGGRLTSATAPSGRGCQFVYDANGRLIAVVFVAGSFQRTWSVQRDGSGSLVGVRAPEVTVNSIPSFFDVVVTVDLDDNVTSFTDRSGATATFAYDAGQPGELASIQAPGNTTAQTIADLGGGTTRFTDEIGIATTHVHDASGRWISRSLGSGAGSGTLTCAYLDPDYAWKASSLANTAGNVWSFDHDALGRTTVLTTPSGSSFDYAYDSSSRLIQALEPLVTDAWGVTEAGRHRSDFIYDANGNLTRTERYVSPASFLTEEYAYDSYGNLVQRIDGNGKSAQFAYDSNGNLVSMTSPEGRSLAWLYESAAATMGYTLPNAFVDGLGVRGDFSRDEWGRLLAELYPDGSGSSYQYDAMNRLVQLVDPTGTSSFAFNPRGQIVDELRGGLGVHYDYLANGLRQHMSRTTPLGILPTDYFYTGKGELAQVFDNGQPTSFLYDSDSRLVRRTLPSGARMERSYQAGMLSAVRHYSASSVLLASYVLAYQQNLRLKSMSEVPGALVRYGYDYLNRLVREERTGANPYLHQWAYDSASRRIQSIAAGQSTFYANDDDGLPVVVMPPPPALPENYVWDGNARLSLFDRGGSSYQMAWDYEGRLARLEQWNGLGWMPSRVYQYDGFDRRIQSHDFDANGVPLSFSSYLYDGRRIAFEDRHDFASGPSSFGATWAGGIVAWNNLTGGTSIYPMTDAFGSVRGATNGSGNSNGYTGVFNAFGLEVKDQGQRPPFAQCGDCGVVQDTLGLLASVGSVYDSTLGRDDGALFSDDFGFSGGCFWPMPPPVGVTSASFELVPIEILPLELISCPPFELEDILVIIDAFSSFNDPIGHGIAGAGFLIDVVVSGPAPASDRALNGDHGPVMQGASTIGHLLAGETDKILQAAETNGLGKLGIWLGENAEALWWNLFGCDG